MDNRGREMGGTWAFFFRAPRLCRAIAHGAPFISGFGLGWKARCVGIWGCGGMFLEF